MQEPFYRDMLLAFMRRFPRACLATLALILLASAAALVPPLVLGRFIDALGDGRLAVVLGFGYFAAGALAGLFESGQNASIVAIGQRLMHDLRSRMAAKLPKLPAAYFTEHASGTTAALFLKDVDAIDVLFTDGILSLFANSLRIVAILAAVFCTSHGLFFLLCIALPVLFLFTRCVQRHVRAAQSANRSAVARIVAVIPETLASFRMIRGLGAEAWMERRYGAALDDGYRAMDRTNFYDSVYSPVIQSAGAAVVAVMMVLAAGEGTRVLFELSVGDAVAMTAYVLAVFEPLAALGRIRAFLEAEELPRVQAVATKAAQAATASDAIASEGSAPCIVFRDVTFGYETAHPVLEHLSFSVRPGEHVVLRGRTGAGKTTILRLVTGLYVPQSGAVLVGGRPAAEVPSAERRKLYGVAGQAFTPVSGTVRDQLTLGDESVTDAMVWHALSDASLDAAVRSLPQGLVTPIASAGFSEGERHLLGFARAIVCNPRILLLDECTSHLDSATEAQLLAAIRRCSAGRAVLSVTHRWSAAMMQTRTIVLDGNGMIDEAKK